MIQMESIWNKDSNAGFACCGWNHRARRVPSVWPARSRITISARSRPKGRSRGSVGAESRKSRRITSLGDIHVSRAYAVGERYRHRNDGGGVALNGKWLCEDEHAAELAVGWIQEPVSEEAVGIHRDRRGRRREGWGGSGIQRETCSR